jgi:hypothetical protein
MMGIFDTEGVSDFNFDFIFSEKSEGKIRHVNANRSAHFISTKHNTATDVAKKNYCTKTAIEVRIIKNVINFLSAFLCFLFDT